MKPADFSIKHPAVIAILLIALLLFGTLSLRNLKQDLLADVALPTIIVLTSYPGVGPKDIEREITDVLEDELSTLTGINSLSSVSQDSSSVITIKFDYGVDADAKIPDIREKINIVQSDLPDGISGPPQLFHMNAGFVPVYTVSIKSEMDKRNLSTFLNEQVVPQLARITGVSEVNIKGETETIVDIEVDIGQLHAKGMAILDVFELLNHHNVNLPAGSVELHNRELKVRTMGEFASLEEIENMVIGYEDNSYIRLKDIATVSIQEKEPETYVTSGDQQIIIFDITKKQGADTNEIIAEAKKILNRISEEQNNTITFETLADQSEEIALAISSVKNAAITGGLLAIFILFVFLHRLRTTLIVGLSIPLSILIAFIAMNLQGLSLNLVSLGGLTVAIGMMVDSSIVVLENIYKHYQQTGDSSQAASKGTEEVGGAIVASTSTSLSVFFPLLVVSGLAGLVLEDAAYTLIYSLSASLLVAIIVVPFLSSLLMKNQALKTDPKNGNTTTGGPTQNGNTTTGGPEGERRGWFAAIERAIDGFIAWLQEKYKKALLSTINNRFFILLMAVAVLVLSVLAADFLGFSFIPSTDMNEMQLEIETPQGFTLEQTKMKVEEMHRLIKKEVPEMETSIYYVGQGGNLGLNKSKSEAFGRIRLKNVNDRERTVFAIMDELQRSVSRTIPDLDVTIVNGGLDSYVAIAAGGEGFIVEVYGNDMDKLFQAAETVQNIMKQDPDVFKTEMNVNFNRQELISDMHLDYAGNLGIIPRSAALTSRLLFNGMEAGTYRDGQNSYDIFLNSSIAGEQITEDILNRISLKSQNGTMVSFGAFSDLKTEQSVSAIHHENRMKAIFVTGYLRGADVRGVSSRVTTRLREMALPVGVNWQIGGSAAEMISSFSSLLITMGIAVFLVYAVMVIQFERFAQPLIVMASIPFTFIGVVAGLLVFGSTLSIISFMGIIALGGIVVNNAIVMIDYINLLRNRDGMGLVPALLAGASSRLKPILMTTLTTILGIIPMAIGFGEGAEVYAPLGQAIAGGLITSTLITLFLVPTLYYILENRLETMRKIRFDKNST